MLCYRISHTDMLSPCPTSTMADLIVIRTEIEKTSHEEHIKNHLIVSDCDKCASFFTKAIAHGRMKHG